MVNVTFEKDFSIFYGMATEGHNELALYGAGNNGDYFGRVLENMGYKFSFYIDNNHELSGKMLHNKPIRHPSSIQTDKIYYIFMALHSPEIILEALMCLEDNGIRTNVFIPNRDLNFIFAQSRKAKLSTQQFTIFSNTCFAGVLYKSHGCQMQTPTVDLIIRPDDYIKFCTNVEEYMENDLSLLSYEYRPVTKENYPIGVLKDIEIHFVHYKTFDEAKLAWERRKQRIVWNNMFFIFHDWHFLFSRDDIEKFLSIKHKNKLVIVSKSFYSGINSPSVLFLKEDKTMSKHVNVFEDYFDFTAWINSSLT